MKVIVTTGPSYEPIDSVRRLTNFSTGELGVRLAENLAATGFQVTCLKGVAATFPGPALPGQVLPFTTNEDLYEQLGRISREQSISALFHVAALCDFKVRQVEDENGQAVQSAKIESRAGSLTLHLDPARKLISELRRLFPRATIVGWKYELAGTRQEALAKAWRQLRENRTDACVLNGRAYGDGFALCTPPDQIRELRDKTEVAQALPAWLSERGASPGSR